MASPASARSYKESFASITVERGVDDLEAVFQRAWRGASFEVKLALLVLLLSILYALVFSNLVYVSLMEQHFQAGRPLPRYAIPPHLHNAAEWLLLVAPATIGWLAALGSVLFLLKRAVRQ
jgi:hypothetical protein